MSDINENQSVEDLKNVAQVDDKPEPEKVSVVNGNDVENTTLDSLATTQENGVEEKDEKIENNVTDSSECSNALESENIDSAIGSCSKVDEDTPIQVIKEIEKDIEPETKLDNLSENIEKSLPKEESISNAQEEWSKRESILLQKIAELEKTQEGNSNKGLQLQLQVKCEENDILKAKVINLETELNAVLKKPNAKNKDIVSKIKKQHDELLTKARGMIFDKTKMIKNQELQIEALTSQVASLKDVVCITKDLLSIRNLEVTHLQEKLQMMDMKIQVEKERHNLMAKKIESGTKLNEELKNEYTTQLAIFKDLKARYEEKFRALEENKTEPSASENP